MRAIKVRGKRLIDGKWIYGVPYLDGCWHIMIDSNTATPEEGTGSWSVDPATIGEFTELTDKNGNEIFEGDILQNEGSAFCDGNTYSTGGMSLGARDVATLSRFRFWLEHETFGYEREELESPEEWVIIGNIHDNPELLKNE